MSDNIQLIYRCTDRCTDEMDDEVICEFKIPAKFMGDIIDADKPHNCPCDEAYETNWELIGKEFNGKRVAPTAVVPEWYDGGKI